MHNQICNPLRGQRIFSNPSRFLGTVTGGLLLVLLSSNGQLTMAEANVPTSDGDRVETLTPPPPTIEGVQIAPITVIDVGHEPRQVLQLKPSVDTAQQSVMTLDMAGTMTASGMTQPLPNTPTTKMVLETDVTQIDETGHRYIDFEYTEVEVDDAPDFPPEALEAMRSQLSQLEGLAGSWVINEQGYLSQFTMTSPDTMPAVLGQSLQQMVDSLQHMSAPFPTEAIGVGAQWQMPYSASMNGITMNGIATYELTSVEGDRVILQAAIDQQGTATNLSDVELPETVDLGVQQLNSSGQGVIEMDLNAVMPVYSDMSLTSISSFLVGHQGIEVPVSMNMVINMSLVSE